MDFNEALRRIAKTPKGLVTPEVEKKTPEGQDKNANKEKAEPIKKKGSD